MTDAIETVLRLVAEGRITPAEAEPLLGALGQEHGPRPPAPASPPGPPEPPFPPTAGSGSGTRSLHLTVTDGGRPSVDLRVPLSLAGVAASMVPGLSAGYAEQIREAVRAGRAGSILEVIDDDGDGVRIALD